MFRSHAEFFVKKEGRKAKITFLILIMVGLAFILYPRFPVAWPFSYILLSGKSTDSIETIEISSPPISIFAPHEHLPGNSVFQHKMTNIKRFTATDDLWILGSAGGEVHNAPNDVLHHSTLVVQDQKQNKCSRKPIDSQSDRTLTLFRGGYPTGYGQLGYGQFIKKGTTLVLSSLFHNASPTTYYNVFVTLRFKAVRPGNALQNLKALDLYSITVSDEECYPYFTVPGQTNGYTKTSSARESNSYITFPEDGNIIMLHGHYHVDDGGKSLTVFLNGKKIHEFPQLKANPDNEVLIPVLVGLPSILSIKKGDTITISTTYDNLSKEDITDAMGQLWIYFSPHRSPQ